MELALVLVILMVIVLCGALMLGYPVAFTLAGTALAFGLIALAIQAATGTYIGDFDATYLALFPDRIFAIIKNDVLLAVPLFVAMGVMLEKSQVAEDLLQTMGQLFGTLRGGLGISVTLVGALMAASTGIVGATVVTMGLLSLPTMLRSGYAPRLASGSIAAAGTLGQIIPPSIVLVLLGDVMSSAYQQAQRDMGIFSPDTLSVGDLFAGALLPGLGLVALYILYQATVAWLKPESSPALATHAAYDRAFFERLYKALLPPVLLIVAVLGAILGGIATPTEAAAVGAVGAILLGAIRIDPAGSRPPLAALVSLVALLAIDNLFDLRIGRADATLADKAAYVVAIALTIGFVYGLWRALRCTWSTGCLGEVLKATMTISAMIYMILIGAALFSLVFRGFGGDEYIANFLNALPGGAFAAILLVMVVMFLLGFFLDFIEITFVVVPIVAPILLAMGVNPVWLGVMMAINLQTSFLTPPFGFALFYLRGVAPDAVRTGDIYKGALPFVAIQILALALLAAFPAVATWLPDQIFG